MRWPPPFRLPAAMLLAASLAGCLQVPTYHEPAGYSSTYHRHLKEARALMYGDVAVNPVHDVAPEIDVP